MQGEGFATHSYIHRVRITCAIHSGAISERKVVAVSAQSRIGVPRGGALGSIHIRRAWGLSFGLADIRVLIGTHPITHQSTPSIHHHTVLSRATRRLAGLLIPSHEASIAMHPLVRALNVAIIQANPIRQSVPPSAHPAQSGAVMHSSQPAASRLTGLDCLVVGRLLLDILVTVAIVHPIRVTSGALIDRGGGLVYGSLAKIRVLVVAGLLTQVLSIEKHSAVATHIRIVVTRVPSREAHVEVLAPTPHAFVFHIAVAHPHVHSVSKGGPNEIQRVTVRNSSKPTTLRLTRVPSSSPIHTLAHEFEAHILVDTIVKSTWALLCTWNLR